MRQVLVIDDEESFASALILMLEMLGWDARYVCSGQAALNQIQAGLTPDVILLDWTMPIMSGPETLKHLKRVTPETPVVLVSGMGLPVLQDLCDKNYKVYPLAKPFKIHELAQFLRTVCSD
jgi:CheY-like chemotaxis protein